MAKGAKIQIVLDADVVIHFAKGGRLSQLPSIFPDYEYVLLEAVHEELLSDIRTQIDNQIMLLKNITLHPLRLVVKCCANTPCLEVVSVRARVPAWPIVCLRTT